MKQMDKFLILFIFLTLFGLIFSNDIGKVINDTGECPLNAPTNLTIVEYNGRLMLSWNSLSGPYCFILHKIDVLLNGVHSQTIRTMRPNFPIDLPKPCVEVQVIVSSTDDSGEETDSISATYYTEVPATFGSVENIWWLRDRTRIIVTYFPPHPYENCNFSYEMYYTFMDTDIVIQNTTTTDLLRMFNYVEARLFCRVISMHLTPILNGIRGNTWFENAVTDQFISDVGPVSSLNLYIYNVLRITWTSPVYYEECIVIYYAEITDVITGEVLDNFVNIETEWIFDYASRELYCVTVSIKVTSYFHGVYGPSVTKYALLGPPPNQITC